MYSYFIGTIKNINPINIVLENNNIGYLIITPNNFNYKVGDSVKIHTYQYIRDNLITLYGFNNEEDRDFFVKLLNVTGIGPKSALSLLSKDDLDYLKNAIDTSNVKYLTTFPGIGTKSANQIILDLKGKISSPIINNSINDAIEALCTLGYNRDKVQSVLKTISINPNMNTSSIVKELLKGINK
jgi:Holliday junction DNA helicase RuvA